MARTKQTARSALTPKQQRALAALAFLGISPAERGHHQQAEPLAPQEVEGRVRRSWRTLAPSVLAPTPASEPLKWAGPLLAASGGRRRAEALLSHFLVPTSSATPTSVSLESLFRWLFDSLDVGEGSVGSFNCLSFLDSSSRNITKDEDVEVEVEEEKSWKREALLTLAPPVMWLLKKVSHTVQTPPSCLSSTPCLERLCAGLRRAEDDDEVASLLGRCLGLYCRLALGPIAASVRQVITQLVGDEKQHVFVAGMLAVEELMKDEWMVNSWMPRIAQLFQRHPALAVRRTAIRLLARNEARSHRVYAPAPLGTELLDMCLADNGVKRMDPEILASILHIFTTAVGSDSIWSLGRHAEMRRVVAQAVHLPHLQVIDQLASLMEMLALRHDDDFGDELAKLLGQMVDELRVRPVDGVDSLLNLSLDCILANRNPCGAEGIDPVQALPLELQGMLDTRVLRHQAVRSQQMARVLVMTKCLWGSPEHCEPWLHLQVSKCLRGADQPWQMQEKGLMLLHCWMLGPPPGSLLSSPIPLQGEPIVNELPFVMQLLSAPQWQVREMACRTLAWFRNEIAVHHRFSRPFSGQYGPAFVAACAKLLQTGPTADSNQIQWELKEEAKKKKKKSEDEGSIDIPSSHFAVSELLHHLLSTCDPADFEGALPQLRSVITASCLPSLPDSPLMEELAIEELIRAVGERD